MKIPSRFFIFIRILAHLVPLLFFLWLFVAVQKGWLGGDPVPELIHYLGKGALNLLIATLCVSPLSKLLSTGQLLRLRRPLGLWCFFWASCHLAAWMSFDLGFNWVFIGAEIIKRKYILLGFTAWLILMALAITSLPVLLRRMGKWWKRLHSLIYFTALMVVIHFWWSLKSGWIEPVIYLGIVALLLWWRKEKIWQMLRGITLAKRKPVTDSP